MRPTIGSLFQALALGAATVAAAPSPKGLSVRENHGHGHSKEDGISPSYDVTACQGYSLVGSPRKSSGGFTADLALRGEPCNAYGVDIKNLTLAVVYEKPEQLHVHIYDTAKNQYQLPNGVIFDRPGDDPEKDAGSTAEDSHLEFHHTDDKAPWAFWITRKSTGDVIFDTRPERIPTYDQPLNETETHRNSTAMPAHPLIFENQYLQLSSALPKDANIYGLGEYISQGFRRNPDSTLQPFFTLDAGDPVDSNMYGYHPVYMEVREGADHGIQSHSVYYQNTAGLDVILRPKVIQYRAIGGTLDFRFFSGDADNGSSSSSNSNDTSADAADVTADKRAALDARQTADASNSTLSTSRSSSLDSHASSNSSSDTDASSPSTRNKNRNSPINAISQYVSFIGLPQMVARWGLGFHMLRWGYDNISDSMTAVTKMRDANVPLETFWNDLDPLSSFRDFTIAPDRYGGEAGMKQLFDYLGDHKQHYIPLVDAAIPAAPTNESDSYMPGTTGQERDVFIKNANGTD